MTHIIITITAGIILFLAVMCLHYYGQYREYKRIAQRLSDYIAKLEKERL